MGIAERREAQREVLRKKIFDAASEIIVSEGFDKLSIRKIAKMIEYSPGVIYNYFKDKSDIIASIVNENYNRVLSNIKSYELDKDSPEVSLKKGLTGFIRLMIENPQQYRAVILNDIEGTNKNLSVLRSDIPLEGEAIDILLKTLRAGMESGIFKDIGSEDAARLLWTACYGLISRIVIEDITDEDYLSRLIDKYVDILINGLCKTN